MQVPEVSRLRLRRSFGMETDSPLSYALLPTLEEVRIAAERLRPVIVRTPLVPLHSFSETSNIFLKPEIHQAVGSFKIRGVYHAVSQLTDQQRQCGLSTVSAGNTAQALAWSGRRFHVSARSVMPDSAPASKIPSVFHCMELPKFGWKRRAGRLFLSKPQPEGGFLRFRAQCSFLCRV